MKTEPGYFLDLQHEEEVRLIEIVIDKSGSVPKTLVERAGEMKKHAAREAKRLRDENLVYEEVWCVFDVDEHPKMHEASQQARDNGISLAVSNPCFELWILLHFRDQTAHIERHNAQSACRHHLNDYKKSVSYGELREGYSDAVRRATALDEFHTGLDQSGANPSSQVYVLTERLRELGRDQQIRRQMAR